MVGTCGTEASKVINQSILLMSMFVELGREGEEIDLGEFPLCRPVVALRVDLRRGAQLLGCSDLSGRRGESLSADEWGRGCGFVDVGFDVG